MYFLKAWRNYLNNSSMLKASTYTVYLANFNDFDFASLVIAVRLDYFDFQGVQNSVMKPLLMLDFHMT